MSPAIIFEQQRILQDQLFSCSVGSNDVEIPVIVIIKQGSSPFTFTCKWTCHSARFSDIFIQPVSYISIKCAIPQVCHQQVNFPVSVNVAYASVHRAGWYSLAVSGYTTGYSHFSEFSMIIPEKKIQLMIISLEKIKIAIVIIIKNGEPHAF